jgi:hypothetical protein
MEIKLATAELPQVDPSDLFIARVDTGSVCSLSGQGVARWRPVRFDTWCTLFQSSRGSYLDEFRIGFFCRVLRKGIHTAFAV